MVSTGVCVQSSVEAAVRSMHERGLDPTSSGVYFGQLLGMADPLTFVLGAHGYRVREPADHCVQPSLRLFMTFLAHIGHCLHVRAGQP